VLHCKAENLAEQLERSQASRMAGMKSRNRQAALWQAYCQVWHGYELERGPSREEGCTLLLWRRIQQRAGAAPRTHGRRRAGQVLRMAARRLPAPSSAYALRFAPWQFLLQPACSRLSRQHTPAGARGRRLPMPWAQASLQPSRCRTPTQAPQQGPRHDCTARRFRCSVKVLSDTSSVLMTSALRGFALL